jgi:hypothetical protein
VVGDSVGGVSVGVCIGGCVVGAFVVGDSDVGCVGDCVVSAFIVGDSVGGCVGACVVGDSVGVGSVGDWGIGRTVGVWEVHRLSNLPPLGDPATVGVGSPFSQERLAALEVITPGFVLRS